METKFDREDGNFWTLERDWILMDQLASFTIVTTEGTKTTFWSQLRAATPDLSHQTPEQLWRRCETLEMQQAKRKESSAEETTKQKDLVFGPSPSLLTHWEVSSSPSSGIPTIVGQLEDGRTVWIHYHSMGRLPGDPLSEALAPGGYIEAVGGRIYELGTPRSNQHSEVTSTAPTFAAWMPNTNNGQSQNNPEKSLAWWMPATTGTVSALLASTILSACIGYGAGMGIVTDTRTSPPATTIARSSAMVPVTRTVISTQASPADAEPSLAERQARTQYRILREERILKRVSNQLLNDKAELERLEQQISQQGSTPPTP